MNMPFFTKNAEVCSLNELNALDSDVTHLTVSDHCGNEYESMPLYFTHFYNLREITIGNDCFIHVDQLNLTGLSRLQKVVIGMNSFTKKKNGFGMELNRRFYVRGCNALKEVRIGSYSFSDYSTAIIENNELLERIVIGEVNQLGYSFYSASLQLGSGYCFIAMTHRLAEIAVHGDRKQCIS